MKHHWTLQKLAQLLLYSMAFCLTPATVVAALEVARCQGATALGYLPSMSLFGLQDEQGPGDRRWTAVLKSGLLCP